MLDQGLVGPGRPQQHDPRRVCSSVAYRVNHLASPGNGGPTGAEDDQAGIDKHNGPADPCIAWPEMLISDNHEVREHLQLGMLPPFALPATRPSP